MIFHGFDSFWHSTDGVEQNAQKTNEEYSGKGCGGDNSVGNQSQKNSGKNQRRQGVWG